MRIRWLDNLKAFGMLLVVFGHMIPDSPLKQYIYSFHVPLFFFVSGYLFDRGKYRFGELVKRKVRTLVVPYFFFAALTFLFWLIVVRGLSVSGRALRIDPLRPLIGILYGIGAEPWALSLNVALWFLPCLFVVEAGFYFVKKTYLLPLFAVAGYLVTFLPFRLPWSIDVALTAIVFYGMGNLYKGVRLPWVVLPLLAALQVAACFLNRPVDMNNLVYGNPLFFYVAALSGVLLWFEVWRLAGKSRILAYIGRNTITLVGSVGIVEFVLDGLSYLIFKVKGGLPGLPFAVAAAVLQVASAVPAMYCMNAWLPFVLGRTRSRSRDRTSVSVQASE